MRKFKIECELETEEFQSANLLESILRIAIEKVFFISVKILSMNINEVKYESAESTARNQEKGNIL